MRSGYGIAEKEIPIRLIDLGPTKKEIVEALKFVWEGGRRSGLLELRNFFSKRFSKKNTQEVNGSSLVGMSC